MLKSTPLAPLSASPNGVDLSAVLSESVATLLAIEAAFLSAEPTPSNTCALEAKVLAVLRDMGLALVRHVLNHAEPAVEDCPKRVEFGDETYRRRSKTPNAIGTLFGEVEVLRCVYECLEPDQPCIWPLELRLGIVAGLATPALAERVGYWSAEHEQSAVRQLLRTDHGVTWSVASLRKVTASVRDGVAGPGITARVERIDEMVAEVEESSGKHPATLAVGRDGVMVPIRT